MTKIIQKVGTLLVVFATVAMPFAQVKAAGPQYNISLSNQNISGTTLSLDGIASATKFAGQFSQYQVVVFWEYVSKQNPGPKTEHVESLTQSGEDFSGTWASSYNYPTSGAKKVIISLCHQSCTGAEGADATVELNIVIPDPVCSDGVDNDSDNLTDYPADPGCSSASDDDEYNAPVNTPPVLTLVGSNPVDITVGGTYTDAGATANDAEDGDITGDIEANGAVDTNTVGSYVITYDVTDSNGAAATQISRTVNVNPVVTECNDDVDNDGDGLSDYPSDLGCSSASDNDENDPPVLTLVGSSTVDVIVGTSYSDAGATADDAEDGDITANIGLGGSVDINTVGTYVITYNVSDSDGAAATPISRTVNVNPVVTECNDGVDNDGDGTIDLQDSGCADSADNDENTPPVLMLTGSSTVNITEGDTYTDDGATATDTEDGDITGNIVLGGNAVDANTVGTYVITYNVSDSDHATATEVTRTVNVLAKGRFMLDITTIGDGSGVITSEDGGINCNSQSEESDCSEVYPVGTEVTLHATPNEGSNFNSSWTVGAGTCTGNTTPCTVTVSGNTSLTAHFALNQTNGGGGGGGGGHHSSSGSIAHHDEPQGEVAGAQTSVLPAGAPNTGAGGTAPSAVPRAELTAVATGALSLRRKTA